MDDDWDKDDDEEPIKEKKVAKPLLQGLHYEKIHSANSGVKFAELDVAIAHSARIIGDSSGTFYSVIRHENPVVLQFYDRSDYGYDETS